MFFMSTRPSNKQGYQIIVKVKQFALLANNLGMKLDRLIKMIKRNRNLISLFEGRPGSAFGWAELADCFADSSKSHLWNSISLIFIK